jgi:hypothetical protein
MPFHCFVVLPRHALAALASPFAVSEELVGRILHREFGGVASEGASANLALGRDPESLGLFAAIELPTLAVARGADEDVGYPSGRLPPVCILPCALTDRHVPSIDRLAPVSPGFTAKTSAFYRVTDRSHLFLLDSIRKAVYINRILSDCGDLFWMASPAQLVETLSLVTGVSLPTIVDIDRKLVKANLRTKGGRGRHAAQMTSLDAARLLTAVLASPQASASAEAVARYGRTQIDRGRSSDKLYGGAKLDDLSVLPPGHSYVEGLASLIASVAGGALARLIAKAEGEWLPTIEVFAFTRATRGRIRVSGLPTGLTASVEYALSPPGGLRSGKAAARRSESAADEPIGDLEQSRRVTETTVLAIAKLLAENSHE